jgi:hypothetical protein
MNTMVCTHAAYVSLGIAATIWVTWTLSRRGLPFLQRWWAMLRWPPPGATC